MEQWRRQWAMEAAAPFAAVPPHIAFEYVRTRNPAHLLLRLERPASEHAAFTVYAACAYCQGVRTTSAHYHFGKVHRRVLIVRVAYACVYHQGGRSGEVKA
eukprot:534822-Pelagomonas_calceolata.AAC.2